MNLFNRKLELDIQIANNIKSYKDTGAGNLKIDFSIEKSMGGIGDRGSITITGLSLEDITAISTPMVNAGRGQIANNYICLKIGYSEMAVLFEGGIYSSSYNVDSPNMSITFDVKAGYSIDRAGEIEINKKNVTLSYLAGVIAEELQVPLKFEATEKTYADFNFSGSVFKLIDVIREACPYSIKLYLSDGIFHVEDINKAGSNILLLNGSSGLIGTPKASFDGIEFTCLYQAQLKIGDMVQLESNKLPIINGTYKVIKMSIKGGNRSKDFYNICHAIKPF